MQKYKFILLITLIWLAACVQKKYKKTVVCYLTVAGFKNIQTVGVRGEGKPLSWDTDLPLTEVVKDSLYTITLSGDTGYKFIEVKFTVNGEFELQNKENRRVLFSEGDTTVYKAVFNSFP